MKDAQFREEHQGLLLVGFQKGKALLFFSSQQLHPPILETGAFGHLPNDLLHQLYKGSVSRLTPCKHVIYSNWGMAVTGGYWGRETRRLNKSLSWYMCATQGKEHDILKQLKYFRCLQTFLKSREWLNQRAGNAQKYPLNKKGMTVNSQSRLGLAAAQPPG